MKRRFPKVGEPGYAYYCKMAWKRHWERHALWFWAYFPDSS